MENRQPWELSTTELQWTFGSGGGFPGSHPVNAKNNFDVPDSPFGAPENVVPETGSLENR